MNSSCRSFRAFAAAAALLVTLGAAATASAQGMSLANAIPCAPAGGSCSNPGFDMRLFRPAVDSKGHFSVNGTDILGAGNISFSLLGDVGFGLFHGGNGGRALIDAQINGGFAFNIGIANVLVFGLQLPFSLLNGPGTANPMSPVPNPALPEGGIGNYNPGIGGMNYQGLGDVSFHLKLRWLRAEYFPVGLAIILQGGFNPLDLFRRDGSTDPMLSGQRVTGARNLAGEPGAFIWPSVAVEFRPSRRVRIDLNLGARIPFGGGSGLWYAGADQSGPASVRYGPSLTFGAGVSYRAAQPIDLVAETYGMLYLTSLGSVPRSLPFEVVLGMKIFVERNSYLMLGGGSGFGFGTRAPAAADGRVFIGFVYEPSIGDSDGDGYRDDVDQCINDPEDFDGFQDDDGCSEPDNDRDGILDADDHCPLIPEDRDGDADSDGCPEGQESDRDGDGIIDRADQCPDEPEDRDSFQDTDGCPDLDNDQDQIPDTVDNCPNEPEDRDDFEDDDGCPDPDNDRDGILDVSDRDPASGRDCRNEPETQNGVDDTDGCADSGDLVILGNEIRLRQQIQFETDSAEIRPISFPIIDQMFNLLQRNPQFEMVEIEGHTDVRATDEHNLRLSNDRANSVMQALVQRGISPARLVAAGYGELCPVDPRNNTRAWERNRRVQFVIVRTRDEGRTTAAAGCAAGREYIPPTVGPPGTGVARERSTRPNDPTPPTSGGTSSPAPGGPGAATPTASGGGAAGPARPQQR